MPKPDSEGKVSYLVVETQNEAQAKQILEQAVSSHGVSIESCNARVDDTFPPDWSALKGKKFAFLTTNDNEKFRLGAGELPALQEAGMQPGMFRDNRGTVQNAREDGMGTRAKKQ